MSDFKTNIETRLSDMGTTAEKATVKQLYNAVSEAAMKKLSPVWNEKSDRKTACYFSAEFLIGRMIYSNLMNLGLLDECKEYLSEKGLDLTVFEDIEDDALGNGGLGRLAACFLDSAATQGLPLTVTESATATDFSDSTSRTASRRKPPMTGWNAATRGACAVRTRL